MSNSQNSDISQTNASALVVEGGAMRSIFSAGLLDGFLVRQFDPFDFYIGVSAGVFNLANFLAGCYGRSLQIFQHLATDKRFVDYRRFLGGGHLLDLDWLFAAATAAYPLEPARVFIRGKPLYIGVTEVDSGKARFVVANPGNLVQAIKASTALPLLYRGFPSLDGRLLTDGGVADGIPIAEAIRLGARQIMVIRSRSFAYRKRDTLGHRLIRWKLRHYPALRRTLSERVARFESALALLRNPPAGIQIIEICPPASFKAGRFNHQPRQLQAGYNAGQAMAAMAIRQWSYH